MTFFTKDISRCLYFYEQIFDLQVNWINEIPHLFIGGKRIAFESDKELRKGIKQHIFNLTCQSKDEVKAFKQKAEFYYYRMYERGRRSSKKSLLWDFDSALPWVQLQDPDGRVWKLQVRNNKVKESSNQKTLHVASICAN